MTSTIDTSHIGKPPLTGPSALRAKRRHVRSLTGNLLLRPAHEWSSADSRLFNTGDFPEVDEKGQEKWPKGDEKSWKDAMRGITSGKLFSRPNASLHLVTGPSADKPDIAKSIVHHVQTSLARAPYNIDDFGAYQAAALSVRDNLIVSYDLLSRLKMRLHASYSHT
jgi:glycogen phosphorylase